MTRRKLLGRLGGAALLVWTSPSFARQHPWRLSKGADVPVCREMFNEVRRLEHSPGDVLWPSQIKQTPAFHFPQWTKTNAADHMSIVRQSEITHAKSYLPDLSDDQVWATIEPIVLRRIANGEIIIEQAIMQDINVEAHRGSPTPPFGEVKPAKITVVRYQWRGQLPRNEASLAAVNQQGPTKGSPELVVRMGPIEAWAPWHYGFDQISVDPKSNFATMYLEFGEMFVVGRQLWVTSSQRVEWISIAALTGWMIMGSTTHVFPHEICRFI